jgi:hypothetical protein
MKRKHCGRDDGAPAQASVPIRSAGRGPVRRRRSKDNITEASGTFEASDVIAGRLSVLERLLEQQQQ